MSDKKEAKFNKSQNHAGSEAADEEQLSGSNSSDFSDDDDGWVPWFCSVKGNEFYCEVDENFIQDGFNLTGLRAQVPFYDHALDMILDAEPSDILTDEQQETVESHAKQLYGLIHARYILTTKGLHDMLDKYKNADFGKCPRVLCRGQSVVPVGLSDTPSEQSVKLYCPKCEDVYNCLSSRHEHIDGAYFGTTFAHLFFLTFPELKTEKPAEKYVPRVFGFRVHKTAYAKSLEARKKGSKRKKHIDVIFLFFLSEENLILLQRAKEILFLTNK